jgi:hypothetical protein
LLRAGAVQFTAAGAQELPVAVGPPGRVPATAGGGPAPRRSAAS